MNNYQTQQFWNDINGVIGFVTSIMVLGFMVGMVRSFQPEEKYHLVRRTKRGSLVTIEKEGNKAIIDVTNWEDMRDLTHLLDVTGIRFRLYQPPKLVGKGWRVEFDFAELESVMNRMRLSSLLLEEPREHHSSSNITTTKLFDWSTMEHKPAITGYVSHNTSPEKALQILKDGYIKPFAGSISFSIDQCFTVDYPSVSFIFPESVIREKYYGREPEYLIHYPKEEIRRIWETEMEVEVKNRLVYIKDCVEILPGRDTCWKYVYGYKYHYVDIRDRDYYPWKEFKREY